jgi:hypothetical protein
MVLVVKNADDIRELLRTEGMLHPFRKPRALIRIPELAPVEARAWEQRLENLRQQCGCTAGALAMGCFVIAFVVYSAWHSSTTPSPLTPAVLASQGAMLVIGLVLSALLGKFAGLLSASWRFRRACLELLERPKRNSRLALRPGHHCCGNR